MFSCVLVFLTAFVALSRCQFDKEVGDACRNRGTCKRIDDCPVEGKLLERNSELVEICGFDEDATLIVCCERRGTPPPSAKLGLRIGDLSISQKIFTTWVYKVEQTMSSSFVSWYTLALLRLWASSVVQINLDKLQRECEEYAKHVFVEEPSLTLAETGNKVNHCARSVEELINGGQPARPKEFPHMAEIGYGRQPTVSFQCGGSLISERWVLSAAHCSDIEKLGRPRFARIGELDSTSDDDGARPVTVNIVKIVNHPDYKKEKMYDDIALFQLEKDVSFSPYIRPVCLQVNHRIGHDYAIAIGFGHINFGGDYHHLLQKVDLNFVDVRKCSKTHGVFSGLSNGISDSKMLCAGDEEGKDTCKGDSGSSLLVKLSHPYCMFSQVGITSFGRPCGEGYPGVYTRVSHYVPWIEGIVWPEEAKKTTKG